MAVHIPGDKTNKSQRFDSTQQRQPSRTSNPEDQVRHPRMHHVPEIPPPMITTLTLENSLFPANLSCSLGAMMLSHCFLFDDGTKMFPSMDRPAAALQVARTTSTGSDSQREQDSSAQVTRE